MSDRQQAEGEVFGYKVPRLTLQVVSNVLLPVLCVVASAGRLHAAVARTGIAPYPAYGTPAEGIANLLFSLLFLAYMVRVCLELLGQERRASILLAEAGIRLTDWRRRTIAIKWAALSEVHVHHVELFGRWTYITLRAGSHRLKLSPYLESPDELVERLLDRTGFTLVATKGDSTTYGPRDEDRPPVR